MPKGCYPYSAAMTSASIPGSQCKGKGEGLERELGVHCEEWRITDLDSGSFDLGLFVL